MNYFDELAFCMREQGFLRLLRFEGKLWISLLDVMIIRLLEKEIENDLL